MAWALAAGDEARPDRAANAMCLAFEHEGQRLDIRLAPLDAARVRRLLAPYAVEARAAVNDLSDVAKVRRWPWANGYRVADRGRIAREIIATYNLMNGAQAVDRSGRRPATPTTIEAIEQVKAAKTTRSYEIDMTVIITDKVGLQHPFDVDLIDPGGSWRMNGHSLRGHSRAQPGRQTRSLLH